MTATKRDAESLDEPGTRGMQAVGARARALWPVWVAVLVAAITFTWAVGLYPRPPIISDALGYTWSARTLAIKHVYNHSYSDSDVPDAQVMPGYPLFLAAFYALGPTDTTFEQAARVVHPRVLDGQLLVAIATVGLIAACGIALGGRLLGLLAGLLAAFYLPFAWTSSVALTETLATALMALHLLSALYVLRAKRMPSQLMFLWLGTSAGLVSIVRPVYLPWVLVPLLIFAAQRRVSGRDLIRRALLTSLGVLLVFAPWWVRNAVVFDHFIPLRALPNVAGAGIGAPRLDALGGRTLSAAEQVVFDEAVAGGRDGDSAVADLRIRAEWDAGPTDFVLRRLSYTKSVLVVPYVAPVEAFSMQAAAAAGPSASPGVEFGPPPSEMPPTFARAYAATASFQIVLSVLALAGMAFAWRRPRVILLACLLAYGILVQSAIIFDMRYYLPSTPAMLLLAATAIAGTVSLVRSRLRRTVPL